MGPKLEDMTLPNRYSDLSQGNYINIKHNHFN